MKTAIETEDLAVYFPVRTGTVKALDGVNLRVEPGRVFGFLGPNGAGKTTAMHVLLGFIAPTRGHARIFEVDVHTSIARDRIGYLPEHPDTYRFLTGREALSFTGRLFGLKGAGLAAAVDRVLALTDMEEAATRRIAHYSRGMMQRICLAQALVNDPDLVILDEPTGGLDPIGRQAIRDLISTLRERGKTVFFSSHELSEVELVCDTIAILNKGRIVAQGPRNELIPPGQPLERYFMDTIHTTNQAAGTP